jgi:hypothetical protein
MTSYDLDHHALSMTSPLAAHTCHLAGKFRHMWGEGVIPTNLIFLGVYKNDGDFDVYINISDVSELNVIQVTKY